MLLLVLVGEFQQLRQLIMKLTKVLLVCLISEVQHLPQMLASMSKSSGIGAKSAIQMGTC